MNDSAVTWEFGGFLLGMNPAMAWSLLGLAALAAIVWTLLSYRHTLRALPLRIRALLILLRLCLVGCILLVLADPSRTSRSDGSAPRHDTLAVLVDRSASMETQDYRGFTRLSDAVRRWKEHEPEARASFREIACRPFARGLGSPGELTSALSAGCPGDSTRLYDAIREAIRSRPGAIVCLTDGLDTTGTAPDSCISDAVQAGVPLYFVPGSNRAQAGDSVEILEIGAPSETLRMGQFNARLLVRVHSTREGSLPVELWSGPRKLAAETLPVSKGVGTLPWSVEVAASEPGMMPLEFRVGKGADEQRAACVTRVIESRKIRLLYYQGALQWGYRFLVNALKGDPSFEITSILNPSLHVRMGPGPEENGGDLPEDARELKGNDIIVLAHVFADRLSPAQQKAISEYARGGGAVLFIAPDDNAVRRFSGTALEKMLPVAFAAASGVNAKAGEFAEKMEQAKSEPTGLVDPPDTVQSELPEAHPFVPAADDVRGMAVFGTRQPEEYPQYYLHAQAREAKPGARVLAVSGASGDDGSPDILLARQRYGAGWSAVLMTDLLWRWKMALPSASHAQERFWQQLFLGMTPPPGNALRIAKVTPLPTAGRTVVLRLEGDRGQDRPSAVLTSPGGEEQPLTLQAEEASGERRWTASFFPKQPGLWKAFATAPDGTTAELSFRIGEQVQALENSNLPPDIDGMRRLAESTGGAIVDDGPVFGKKKAGSEPEWTRRVKPLWDTGWLLVALLGIYGAELIVRRRNRLL